MVGFPRKDSKIDKELQQQQQQQQQLLLLLQSSLLVLVVLITTYIGFMQHDQATSISQLAVMQKDEATAISQLAVMQKDQATAISQLAVMQKDQATAISQLTAMQKDQLAAIGMIDLKLNSIIGGTSVALAIFAGLGKITTTIKNSQDIALNNMKLEELRNNLNGTESKT
jgi:hypothetical protein